MKRGPENVLSAVLQVGTWSRASKPTSPDTAEKIRAHVDANHAKLEACTGHSFEDVTPDREIGKRYACGNCLGDIDATAYRWYRRGRKEGAK